MKRRLAAILATDVVGYSRLIRADEEGTITALKALRVDLIDPKIAEHHGRVVKLMGDGMLAEFPSVVDAVRAAVETQAAVAKHNAGLPEDKRIEFRVGVNLGDVVIDGNDIHGDGVNVAARLESLAEPGGICISGKVYEEVRDRTDLAFEDLGEQQVKNIDRPVRVWRWIANAGVTASVSAKTNEPFQLPDKPTIAVLPFVNLSGDPEQEYFADGISEDIITGLSKNPDLFVISRNSTFTFKGKSVRIRDVSEDLGAQYVLEGSVRKAGQRIRVTAQLIDATRDRHIWAERYDRDLDDIFAVQDEVVGSIVHALVGTDGALERLARQRSIEASTTTQSAYDCYLKAREFYYRHRDAGGSLTAWSVGIEEAEVLFEKTIELDPGFARAYSALAWLHLQRFKLLLTASFESMEQKVLDLAFHALRLDPDDYRAHMTLGRLYSYQGKHAKGRAEFDRALRINPNDTNVLAVSANALVYCERVDEALERCQRAILLNPNAPDWYWWTLGFSYFHLGRYEEALEALERMTAPDKARRVLAATYAHLGRLDEARHEAEEFMKVVPNFSIKEWARTEPYTDPNELQRYVDGMRKAGLPE